MTKIEIITIRFGFEYCVNFIIIIIIILISTVSLLKQNGEVIKLAAKEKPD